MWFRKQDELVEYVSCGWCGCLMRKARKLVKVEYRMMGDSPPWRSTETYCGRCAPPYDLRQEEEGRLDRYYRTEPAQNIEITEKGKAIS